MFFDSFDTASSGSSSETDSSASDSDLTMEQQSQSQSQSPAAHRGAGSIKQPTTAILMKTTTTTPQINLINIRVYETNSSQLFHGQRGATSTSDASRMDETAATTIASSSPSDVSSRVDSGTADQTSQPANSTTKSTTAAPLPHQLQRSTANDLFDDLRAECRDCSPASKLIVTCDANELNRELVELRERLVREQRDDVKIGDQVARLIRRCMNYYQRLEAEDEVSEQEKEKEANLSNSPFSSIHSSSATNSSAMTSSNHLIGLITSVRVCMVVLRTLLNFDPSILIPILSVVHSSLVSMSPSQLSETGGRTRRQRQREGGELSSRITSMKNEAILMHELNPFFQLLETVIQSITPVTNGDDETKIQPRHDLISPFSYLFTGHTNPSTTAIQTPPRTKLPFLGTRKQMEVKSRELMGPSDFSATPTQLRRSCVELRLLWSIARGHLLEILQFGRLILSESIHTESGQPIGQVTHYDANTIIRTLGSHRLLSEDKNIELIDPDELIIRKRIEVEFNEKRRRLLSERRKKTNASVRRRRIMVGEQGAMPNSAPTTIDLSTKKKSEPSVSVSPSSYSSMDLDGEVDELDEVLDMGGVPTERDSDGNRPSLIGIKNPVGLIFVSEFFEAAEEESQLTQSEARALKDARERLYQANPTRLRGPIKLKPTDRFTQPKQLYLKPQELVTAFGLESIDSPITTEPDSTTAAVSPSVSSSPKLVPAPIFLCLIFAHLDRLSSRLIHVIHGGDGETTQSTSKKKSSKDEDDDNDDDEDEDETRSYSMEMRNHIDSLTFCCSSDAFQLMIEMIKTLLPFYEYPPTIESITTTSTTSNSSPPIPLAYYYSYLCILLSTVRLLGRHLYLLQLASHSIHAPHHPEQSESMMMEIRELILVLLKANHRAPIDANTGGIDECMRTTVQSILSDCYQILYREPSTSITSSAGRTQGVNKLGLIADVVDMWQAEESNKSSSSGTLVNVGPSSLSCPSIRFASSLLSSSCLVSIYQLLETLLPVEFSLASTWSPIVNQLVLKKKHARVKPTDATAKKDQKKLKDDPSVLAQLLSESQTSFSQLSDLQSAFTIQTDLTPMQDRIKQLQTEQTAASRIIRLFFVLLNFSAQVLRPQMLNQLTLDKPEKINQPVAPLDLDQSLDLFNRSLTKTMVTPPKSSTPSISLTSSTPLDSPVRWVAHPGQTNGSCTEISPNQYKVTSLDKFAHYLVPDILIKDGSWYYVVKIENSAIHQIGWCSPKYKLRNYANISPYGFGDDDLSWSLDQSRPVIYHGLEASSIKYPSDGSTWSSGDFIGVGVSIDSVTKKATMRFWQNGKDLGVAFKDQPVGDGFMPAVSVRGPESSYIVLLSHPQHFDRSPLPSGYKPISQFRSSKSPSIPSPRPPQLINTQPIHQQLYSTLPWFVSLLDFFAQFQSLLFNRVNVFLSNQALLMTKADPTRPGVAQVKDMGQPVSLLSTSSSSTNGSSRSFVSSGPSGRSSTASIESFNLPNNILILEDYCLRVISTLLIDSDQTTTHIYFDPPSNLSTSSTTNSLPRLSSYSFTILHQVIQPFLRNLDIFTQTISSHLSIAPFILTVLPILQLGFEALQQKWIKATNGRMEESGNLSYENELMDSNAHRNAWLVRVLFPLYQHVLSSFARTMVMESTHTNQLDQDQIKSKTIAAATGVTSSTPPTSTVSEPESKESVESKNQYESTSSSSTTGGGHPSSGEKDAIRLKNEVLMNEMIHEFLNESILFQGGLLPSQLQSPQLNQLESSLSAANRMTSTMDVKLNPPLTLKSSFPFEFHSLLPWTNRSVTPSNTDNQMSDTSTLLRSLFDSAPQLNWLIPFLQLPPLNGSKHPTPIPKLQKSIESLAQRASNMYLACLLRHTQQTDLLVVELRKYADRTNRMSELVAKYGSSESIPPNQLLSIRNARAHPRLVALHFRTLSLGIELRNARGSGGDVDQLFQQFESRAKFLCFDLAVSLQQTTRERKYTHQSAPNTPMMGLPTTSSPIISPNTPTIIPSTNSPTFSLSTSSSATPPPPLTLVRTPSRWVKARAWINLLRHTLGAVCRLRKAISSRRSIHAEHELPPAKSKLSSMQFKSLEPNAQITHTIHLFLITDFDHLTDTNDSVSVRGDISLNGQFLSRLRSRMCQQYSDTIWRLIGLHFVKQQLEYLTEVGQPNQLALAALSTPTTDSFIQSLSASNCPEVNYELVRLVFKELMASKTHPTQSNSTTAPPLIPYVTGINSAIFQLLLNRLSHLPMNHIAYDGLWIDLLQLVNSLPKSITSRNDPTMRIVQLNGGVESLNEWDQWIRMNKTIENWLMPRTLADVPTHPTHSSIIHHPPMSLSVRVSSWSLYRFMVYYSTKSFVEWTNQQEKIQDQRGQQQSRSLFNSTLTQSTPTTTSSLSSSKSLTHLSLDSHPSAIILQQTLNFIQQQLSLIQSKRGELRQHLSAAFTELSHSSKLDTPDEEKKSEPSFGELHGFAHCPACRFSQNELDAVKCLNCGYQQLQPNPIPPAAFQSIPFSPHDSLIDLPMIGSIPTSEPSARVVSRREDGQFGCSHYPRLAKILAPCCNKFFNCRHCHNEQSDHQIDRRAINQMVCMKCVATNELVGKNAPVPTTPPLPRMQPISNQCVDCSSQMAGYHCGICRVFDGDLSHDNYHCTYCVENGQVGLCRRGQARSFHCHKCGVCQLETHICPLGGPTTIAEAKKADPRGRTLQEQKAYDAATMISPTDEDVDGYDEPPVNISFSSISSVIASLTASPHTLMTGHYVGQFQLSDDVKLMDVEFDSSGASSNGKHRLTGRMKSGPIGESLTQLSSRSFTGEWTPATGAIEFISTGDSVVGAQEFHGHLKPFNVSSSTQEIVGTWSSVNDPTSGGVFQLSLMTDQVYLNSANGRPASIQSPKLKSSTTASQPAWLSKRTMLSIDTFLSSTHLGEVPNARYRLEQKLGSNHISTSPFIYYTTQQLSILPPSSRTFIYLQQFHELTLYAHQLLWLLLRTITIQPNVIFQRFMNQSTTDPIVVSLTTSPSNLTASSSSTSWISLLRHFFDAHLKPLSTSPHPLITSLQTRLHSIDWLTQTLSLRLLRLLLPLVPPSRVIELNPFLNECLRLVGSECLRPMEIDPSSIRLDRSMMEAVATSLDGISKTTRLVYSSVTPVSHKDGVHYSHTAYLNAKQSVSEECMGLIRTLMQDQPVHLSTVPALVTEMDEDHPDIPSAAASSDTFVASSSHVPEWKVLLFRYLFDQVKSTRPTLTRLGQSLGEFMSRVHRRYIDHWSELVGDGGLGQIFGAFAILGSEPAIREGVRVALTTVDSNATSSSTSSTNGAHPKYGVVLSLSYSMLTPTNPNEPSTTSPSTPLQRVATVQLAHGLIQRLPADQLVVVRDVPLPILVQSNQQLDDVPSNSSPAALLFELNSHFLDQFAHILIGPPPSVVVSHPQALLLWTNLQRRIFASLPQFLQHKRSIQLWMGHLPKNDSSHEVHDIDITAGARSVAAASLTTVTPPTDLLRLLNSATTVSANGSTPAPPSLNKTQPERSDWEQYLASLDRWKPTSSIKEANEMDAPIVPTQPIISIKSDAPVNTNLAPPTIQPSNRTVYVLPQIDRMHVGDVFTSWSIDTSLSTSSSSSSTSTAGPIKKEIFLWWEQSTSDKLNGSIYWNDDIINQQHTKVSQQRIPICSISDIFLGKKKSSVFQLPFFATYDQHHLLTLVSKSKNRSLFLQARTLDDRSAWVKGFELLSSGAKPETKSLAPASLTIDDSSTNSTGPISPPNSNDQLAPIPITRSESTGNTDKVEALQTQLLGLSLTNTPDPSSTKPESTTTGTNQPSTPSKPTVVILEATPPAACADDNPHGHLIGHQYSTPLHVAHPLDYLAGTPYSARCDICGKSIRSTEAMYNCMECRWDCHTQCFLTVSENNIHQHSFDTIYPCTAHSHHEGIRLKKQEENFVCSVCKGSSLKGGLAYRCIECSWLAHPTCVAPVEQPVNLSAAELRAAALKSRNVLSHLLASLHPSFNHKRIIEELGKITPMADDECELSAITTITPTTISLIDSTTMEQLVQQFWLKLYDLRDSNSTSPRSSPQLNTLLSQPYDPSFLINFVPYSTPTMKPYQWFSLSESDSERLQPSSEKVGVHEMASPHTGLTSTQTRYLTGMDGVIAWSSQEANQPQTPPTNRSSVGLGVTMHESLQVKDYLEVRQTTEKALIASYARQVIVHALAIWNSSDSKTENNSKTNQVNTKKMEESDAESEYKSSLSSMIMADDDTKLPNEKPTLLKRGSSYRSMIVLQDPVPISFPFASFGLDFLPKLMRVLDTRIGSSTVDVALVGDANVLSIQSSSTDGLLMQRTIRAIVQAEIKKLDGRFHSDDSQLNPSMISTSHPFSPMVGPTNSMVQTFIEIAPISAQLQRELMAIILTSLAQSNTLKPFMSTNPSINQKGQPIKGATDMNPLNPSTMRFILFTLQTFYERLIQLEERLTRLRTSNPEAKKSFEIVTSLLFPPPFITAIIQLLILHPSPTIRLILLRVTSHLLRLSSIPISETILRLFLDGTRCLDSCWMKLPDAAIKPVDQMIPSNQPRMSPVQKAWIDLHLELVKKVTSQQERPNEMTNIQAPLVLPTIMRLPTRVPTKSPESTASSSSASNTSGSTIQDESLECLGGLFGDDSVEAPPTIAVSTATPVIDPLASVKSDWMIVPGECVYRYVEVVRANTTYRGQTHPADWLCVRLDSNQFSKPGEYGWADGRISMGTKMIQLDSAAISSPTTPIPFTSFPVNLFFTFLPVLQLLSSTPTSSSPSLAPPSDELLNLLVNGLLQQTELDVLSLDGGREGGVRWHLERLRSNTAINKFKPTTNQPNEQSTIIPTQPIRSSSAPSFSLTSSASSVIVPVESARSSSIHVVATSQSILPRIYSDLATYINHSMMKATARSDSDQQAIITLCNTYLRSLLSDPSTKSLPPVASLVTKITADIAKRVTDSATTTTPADTTQALFDAPLMTSFNDPNINKSPLLSSMTIYEFTAHALLYWQLNMYLRLCIYMFDLTAIPDSTDNHSIVPMSLKSTALSAYSSIHTSATLGILLESHHLFFWYLKHSWLQHSHTKSLHDNNLSVSIDSFKATQLQPNSMTVANIRRSIFGQLFAHLYPTMHLKARCSGSGRAFTVNYIGLYSYDAGGPYRETLSTCFRELQSNRLPFFVPVPNAQSGTGSHRDCWVPRPYFVAPSPFTTPTPEQERKFLLHRQCYRFIGQLMGLAIRSRQLLALNFPTIIWKGILQTNRERHINMTNIEEIDLLSANLLKDMRQESERLRRNQATADQSKMVVLNAEESIPASAATSTSASSLSGASGVAPSTFLFDSVMRDMKFEVVAADGRTHQLLPNGHTIGLSSANWNQYIYLLQEFRLHEFDAECREMHIGLTSVVPPGWLQLLTWREFKYSVVGTGTIDIDFLEQMSNVDSTLKDTPTMKFFWNVLKTRFTPEQQAQFLTFTWGRSTLPTRESDWERRFSIKPLSASKPNETYPVAHTCLSVNPRIERKPSRFTLDLPAYTSEDILYTRLLFAIQNCVEIDGDEGHVSASDLAQRQEGIAMTREQEESEEWQFR